MEIAQSSCKIQCHLNNHFESQFSSPILYEVRFQSTARTVFNNDTAKITWNANLTILCLYA
uniref:Uncharacterized protein n=1 Tax=Rhizophora mucronata TaxID=61149 RepID=A0A2P2PNT3_RHIMU